MMLESENLTKVPQIQICYSCHSEHIRNRFFVRTRTAGMTFHPCIPMEPQGCIAFHKYPECRLSEEKARVGLDIPNRGGLIWLYIIQTVH